MCRVLRARISRRCGSYVRSIRAWLMRRSSPLETCATESIGSRYNLLRSKLMQTTSRASTPAVAQPSWQQRLARYQRPDLWRSLWQVANTFIPFFGLLYVLYLSLIYPYWLTLALALPAAGLLVRIF